MTTEDYLAHYGRLSDQKEKLSSDFMEMTDNKNSLTVQLES